jgi:hypothetical protein
MVQIGARWGKVDNEFLFYISTLYSTSGKTARKLKNRIMEALLIINSFLVAICLYFIKDFHTEFKGVAKKVQELKKNLEKLSGKVNLIAERLKNHIKSVSKTSK